MTLLCAGECGKCPFLSCNFHPGFSAAMHGCGKADGGRAHSMRKIKTSSRDIGRDLKKGFYNGR